MNIILLEQKLEPAIFGSPRQHKNTLTTIPPPAVGESITIGTGETHTVRLGRRLRRWEREKRHGKRVGPTTTPGITGEFGGAPEAFTLKLKHLKEGLFEVLCNTDLFVNGSLKVRTFEPSENVSVDFGLLLNERDIYTCYTYQRDSVYIPSNVRYRRDGSAYIRQWKPDPGKPICMYRLEFTMPKH